MIEFINFCQASMKLVQQQNTLGPCPKRMRVNPLIIAARQAGVLRYLETATCSSREVKTALFSPRHLRATNKSIATHLQLRHIDLPSAHATSTLD